MVRNPRPPMPTAVPPESSLDRTAAERRPLTVTLPVPPLRDRTEDLPLLCAYFLEKFNGRYRKRVLTISPAFNPSPQRLSSSANQTSGA